MTPTVEMTYYGLVKTVTVSEFKAHISGYLRSIREGARVVISNRDRPVAEVVPYQPDQDVPLAVRAPKAGPFQLPRSRVHIRHDPLEFLLEDRDSR